jgi:hypothetical protein
MEAVTRLQPKSERFIPGQFHTNQAISRVEEPLHLRLYLLHKLTSGLPQGPKGTHISIRQALSYMSGAARNVSRLTTKLRQEYQWVYGYTFVRHYISLPIPKTVGCHDPRLCHGTFAAVDGWLQLNISIAKPVDDNYTTS